jgi:hypothetical protein
VNLRSRFSYHRLGLWGSTDPATNGAPDALLFVRFELGWGSGPNLSLHPSSASLLELVASGPRSVWGI